MAPIEDADREHLRDPDHDTDSADGDARAAKRVRFSTTVSSNDVTQLAIVTRSAQAGAEAEEEEQEITFFPPRFTYHSFGTEETIQGFEGLEISVLFNAYDFSAFLDVKYNEQESTADDILGKITPSLPEGFTQDRAVFDENLRNAEQQFVPQGQLVGSYSKQIDGNERHFEIYEVPLDGNDAAQKLHANMQTMALWFIEGADGIDVTDPRWVVYLTYERSKPDNKRFSPVGYVTLFKFINPLGRKGPGAGTTTNKSEGQQVNETHRICQVLIFPAHQRQGHGEHLVQCISQRAVVNDKMYELTVEDPVPAFAQLLWTNLTDALDCSLVAENFAHVQIIQLRNLVDVKNCLKQNFFSLPPSESAEDVLAPAQGTASLRLRDIHAVQEVHLDTKYLLHKLKITVKQVQTCYEVLKLRFVDKRDEEQLKKYRLEVKKRLFKLHAEELEGIASAERRKAFLEVEYQALDEQYTQLLAKIGAAC